jgi:pimeloyl-ACP methyl ester carboxylesterase
MIKDKFYWIETGGGHCPVYTLFPTPSSPAVIFCHDYKGSSQEENRFFWKLSRTLYENGIGSVRFDYNGFGNSTGDSTMFTIESGLMDTVTIVQKVALLTEVDPSKLAILGLGMGGRMAAYLLGNSPDLNAGILLNPANTHFKTEAELEELQFGYEGDTAWDNGWEFTKEFFNSDNFGEGANEIIDADVPVLLITGYDDEFIPHHTSEDYLEKLSLIQYEEIMNADHLFSSPEAEKEVTELIIKFLNKNLLGKEDPEEESEPLEELEVSNEPPLAAVIKSVDTVETETAESTASPESSEES